MSESDWKTYCNTQVVLMRSYFVVQAALRGSAIAGLPMVSSRADPVNWLRDQLKVGFLRGSEVLAVRMVVSEDQSDQAIKLVDAVVDAYQEEVVGNEKQRGLITRDALARSLGDLYRELTNKMEETQALAIELGLDEACSSRFRQRIDLGRLERMDSELTQLQNELLSLQIEIGLRDDEKKEPTLKEQARISFCTQRIQALEKSRAELEEKINRESERSVDLEVRRREVDGLQKTAAKMAMRLEIMDVEANAPDRVRVIQPAVVSRVIRPAKSAL